MNEYFVKLLTYKTKNNFVITNLFLCDTEINIGDTFWANEAFRKCLDIKVGNYPYQDNYGSWHSKQSFRVIGEISPNVTWLKDLDKVKKTDVGIHYNFVGENSEDEFFTLEEWPKIVKKKYKNKTTRKLLLENLSIVVKGPCGHFH